MQSWPIPEPRRKSFDEPIAPRAGIVVAYHGKKSKCELVLETRVDGEVSREEVLARIPFHRVDVEFVEGETREKNLGPYPDGRLAIVVWLESLISHASSGEHGFLRVRFGLPGDRSIVAELDRLVRIDCVDPDLPGWSLTTDPEGDRGPSRLFNPPRLRGHDEPYPLLAVRGTSMEAATEAARDPSRPPSDGHRILFRFVD